MGGQSATGHTMPTSLQSRLAFLDLWVSALLIVLLGWFVASFSEKIFIATGLEHGPHRSEFCRLVESVDARGATIGNSRSRALARRPTRLALGEETQRGGQYGREREKR